MTTIESNDLVEVVRASLLRNIIKQLKELREMRDGHNPIGFINQSIGNLTVALLEYEDAAAKAVEAEKEAKRAQGREVAAAIFESAKRG